jgi:hypothetical protein
MPKLLEFGDDGGTVLFQVPARTGEIKAVGKTADVIEKVTKSIGEVFGVVGGIAAGFSEAVKDAPVQTAQLEFSLQFTASGRLYVVEAQGQGTITVTLTLSPRGPAPEAADHAALG